MPDTIKLRISEFRIYPGAELEMINLQMLSDHAAFQAVNIASVQAVLPSRYNSKIGLKLDHITIERPKPTGSPAATPDKIDPIMINHMLAGSKQKRLPH